MEGVWQCDEEDSAWSLGLEIVVDKFGYHILSEECKRSCCGVGVAVDSYGRRYEDKYCSWPFLGYSCVIVISPVAWCKYKQFRPQRNDTYVVIANGIKWVTYLVAQKRDYNLRFFFEELHRPYDVLYNAT